jgi:hypothetical protein
MLDLSNGSPIEILYAFVIYRMYATSTPISVFSNTLRKKAWNTTHN